MPSRSAGVPVVAFVGRPNVGKSTLFNRVVGDARAAIVEDRARTTRDRLYGDAEWNGRRFVVVDTGGLEIAPGDPIEEQVQVQARLAINVWGRMSRESNAGFTGWDRSSRDGSLEYGVVLAAPGG